MEQLIKIIKQQAEVFLLDASGFFPFGAALRKENKIIPIGAYIEDPNDRPEYSKVIELLEGSIKKDVLTGDYVIGAIAIDVFIKEDGLSYDANEIRLFEKDKITKMFSKYRIKNRTVEFSDYNMQRGG